MKFFITGTIRSEKGPRAILTFTLLFFLVFLAMNVALLFAQTGLLPSQIAELHEPSTVMRLERTHVQLFLFTLVYVITASIFFQTRIGPGAKRFGLLAGALLTFFYVVSYPLLLTADAWPVYSYSIASITVHLWYALLIAYLLFDLYAPAGHLASGEH
ncbi:MAG: hypothetical protein F9K24_06355 [Leptonema illini]|uniref:Uncharacterized protein n=1 Tax=Leptonema illini TaxID=183 RepID=A0A833H2N2_9LEPT|nr:MAG: hypothetical protein F9K24_06355 [Leptonema illini]